MSNTDISDTEKVLEILSVPLTTPGRLEQYNFIASTDGVTINGIFIINAPHNKQIGAPFAYSITTQTAVTFATIAGGTIPAGATGVIFDISGDLRYTMISSTDVANSLATAMTANNKTLFPTLSAGKNYSFGLIV